MQNLPDLLRVTLHLVRDAVVITDAGALVQLLNPAAEVLCGVRSEDAAGRPVDEVFPVVTDAAAGHREHSSLRALAEQFIREGAAANHTELFVVRDRNGRQASVEASGSRYSTGDGADPGCVLVLHDTSRAMELAERISYVAQHDPLTGLPNRILLVDRLEQGTKVADRNGEQLAVMFVGLDDLGRLRNEAGGSAADQLLREVAFRIGAVLRESDTVCRLGADEFVLLAQSVRSVSDAEAVAAKLIDEIARPHVVDGKTMRTSCSIGVSVYPQDANDAATLMRLADGAMRQAQGEFGSRYRLVREGATAQARPERMG